MAKPSKSKTYKNITDSGYTTYHSGGSKSSTYKNVLSEGYTTYHDDGSKSVTHKNLTDSGFTTYRVPNDGAFDFLYVIFGGMVIALSLLSLFALGSSAILSIALIAISILARILLNRKRGTTIFVLWAHPFTLLGWRLLVNSMWQNSNGNFLEPFGILFLSIGVIATLFLDCGESFGMFFYAFATMIVMFVMKAYGEYAPYWMVVVMCGIALIATLIKVTKKKV